MVLKVDTSLIAERKGDTVIVSCNGGDVDVRGPSHTSLFDFLDALSKFLDLGMGV